jgi:hypothetical protein
MDPIQNTDLKEKLLHILIVVMNNFI